MLRLFLYLKFEGHFENIIYIYMYKWSTIMHHWKNETEKRNSNNLVKMYPRWIYLESNPVFWNTDDYVAESRYGLACHQHSVLPNPTKCTWNVTAKWQHKEAPTMTDKQSTPTLCDIPCLPVSDKPWELSYTKAISALQHVQFNIL